MNKSLTYKSLLLLLPLLAFLALQGFAQSNFTEGEIVYGIRVSSKGKLSENSVQKLENGKMVFNFKNYLFRSDIDLGKMEYINIHNSRDHKGFYLIKNGSDENYLIEMNAEDLKKEASKFDKLTFTPGSETKTIAGYKCHQATGHLADGRQFVVFYTKELQPAFEDYDPRFRGLGGIPLEFQMNVKHNQATLTLTASSVKAGFQSTTLFQLPTGGFRALTYEQFQSLRKKRE